MTGQTANEYENNKIINQFRELLNIPTFKKVMVHKIEELKILLSEDIGHYNELRTMLDAGTVPELSEENKEKRVAFQLRRMGKDLWIPILPNQRKGDTDVYQVVPEAVIDYMVEYKTEPGLIVAKPGLKLPALPGKTFDLYFERLREDFISGIIAGDRLVGEKPMPEPPGMDPSSPQKDVDLKSLRRFFQYLMNHPVLYTHMINQFELVWKPLLDRRHEQKSS